MKLTREKITELFGIPTKQEKEPYNSMTIKQLLFAYLVKESIWWCEPCNDFHTSSWNHMRGYQIQGELGSNWKDSHKNTKKLLSIIKNETDNTLKKDIDKFIEKVNKERYKQITKKRY